MNSIDLGHGDLPEEYEPFSLLEYDPTYIWEPGEEPVELEYERRLQLYAEVA
jgi:hypothetical protein